MTIGVALKILRMTKGQLAKKFGSQAKGLAKRIQAGDVQYKWKKGYTYSDGGWIKPKPSRYQPTKKQAKAEHKAEMKYERSQRRKADRAKAEYRDHFDESGRRHD